MPKSTASFRQTVSSTSFLGRLALTFGVPRLLGDQLSIKPIISSCRVHVGWTAVLTGETQPAGRLHRSSLATWNLVRSSDSRCCVWKHRRQHMSSTWRASFHLSFLSIYCCYLPVLEPSPGLYLAEVYNNSWLRDASSRSRSTAQKRRPHGNLYCFCSRMF